MVVVHRAMALPIPLLVPNEVCFRLAPIGKRRKERKTPRVGTLEDVFPLGVYAVPDEPRLSVIQCTGGALHSSVVCHGDLRRWGWHDDTRCCGNTKAPRVGLL